LKYKEINSGNPVEVKIEMYNETNHGPFIILMVLYLISLTFSMIPFLKELRYIKYIVPFISPFFLLPRKNYFRMMDELYIKNIVMYFLIVIQSLFFVYLSKPLYQTFFEETVFFMTPLLFIYFLFKYYNHNGKDFYIKFLFWGIVFTYAVHLLSPERGTANPFFVNPIDLFMKAEKTMGIASHGFYIGYFMIYFALKKNYRYFIYSLLITMMASKRIAIGALILVYLIYKFSSKDEWSSFKRVYIPVIMIVVNLILVYLLYNYTLGEYDDIIFNATGTYAGDLTTGRFWIYNLYMTKHVLSWSGDGIGYVTKTISEIIGMKYNFHSDILKNYLEFGPVVFCLWIYFFYRINVRNLKMFLYVIYTNVLFISDNVFTYFDVLFLLYFFISITVIEEKEEILLAEQRDEEGAEPVTN